MHMRVSRSVERLREFKKTQSSLLRHNCFVCTREISANQRSLSAVRDRTFVHGLIVIDAACERVYLHGIFRLSLTKIETALSIFSFWSCSAHRNNEESPCIFTLRSSILLSSLIVVL